MKKKALFFVNSLGGGGAERVCLNLAMELFRQGYSSDFITLYEERNEYELPPYINLQCLNVEKSANAVVKIFKLIRKIPQVNKWLKEKNYELISAHLQMSHLLAAFSLVRNRTLFVMHNSQWPNDPNRSTWYKIGLKLFFKGKHIVTVSEGVRRELICDYGMSEKWISAIYNPLPLKELVSKIKDAVPYPKPYIIFVGRLTPPKRPDIAIKLFYDSNLYQQYDLVILGDGPLRTVIEKLIEEFNLRDSVFLAGFQKNPYPWIEHAKLMLSISDSEACPMNIVEALACGTGVVAANCRFGPNEILTGEFSNYLIDPKNNYEESIKILQNAISEYPEIQLLSLKKFDATNIAKQYLTEWSNMFL